MTKQQISQLIMETIQEKKPNFDTEDHEYFFRFVEFLYGIIKEKYYFTDLDFGTNDDDTVKEVVELELRQLDKYLK